MGLASAGKIAGCGRVGVASGMPFGAPAIERARELLDLQFKP